MSNPGYNPDEYEEIIPEEEKRDEEEGLIDDEEDGGTDNQVNLSKNPEDLSGHTDNYQTPQPINEQEEPISQRPNNFQSINAKKTTDKKARSIRFIKTFIRNRNRTMDDITRELGITRESGKKYLAEYVSSVIKALESGMYPNMVVQYYNDTSMPKHQRLTVQDVQDMKPIILRYHSINVDQLIGAHADKPRQQGQHSPIIHEFIDDVMGNGGRGPAISSSIPQQQPDDGFYEEDDAQEQEPQGRFKTYNEFKQSRPVSNPRELTTESSIGDVIEFGIINSGQPDMAKIKRIKTMFMSNPPHYLSDESRFQDLLEANDIKPKVITTFMDWLKYTAPIKPNERIGFLAAAKAQGPVYQQPGGPYQQGGGATQQRTGQPFKKFDINEYDEYAQFLYTEGVYQYGLPPEHPINKQSYQRYMDDKKYEEDQKRTMRQIDMMVKQNILRMGPGGQMMNGQQQMGGPTTAFDDRYLMERGIVVPDITYTEDGKKIVRLVPTGRPMYGGFAGGGDMDSREKDDFTDSISKFSRFLEAVRPMMNPQGQGMNGQPASNPLLDRVMEAAINKLFSKADETPSKVLENQMSLFQQFKTLFPTTDTQPLNETQARLQIELAKLNTDKEFHMQEVDFKRRQLEMEEKRHEDAKSESKDGISWIMDAMGKVFTTFQPVITSLLMGQGGGGLSGMLGGALGGGQQPNPMGPMGQMSSPTGMDMMGGNPFTMGPEGPEMMDNIPAPTQMPQDFMPQNPEQFPQPGYAGQPQQEQYYSQPQQQYQAGPPPYQPQPPVEPPFPQMQPPPDFLPETPPEPFAVPPPKSPPSENDFLNSLTPEELATLTVDELAEVERRISSKQGKLERVLNSIKSTKVRKQFGYRQPVDPDYSALDVPKDIPSDYDGMPDYHGELSLPPPSPSPPQEEQDFDVGATLTSADQQTEQLLNTTMEPMDFESFNSDVYEITDMGNDNQQFNQQNEANQKEFIDKIAAIDAAEALRVENEKRKAAGLAPLATLETVNVAGKEQSADAADASDSPLNNDAANNDPSLNESKTGPSESFQKEQNQTSKDQKHSSKNKSSQQDKDKKTSHKGQGNTNSPASLDTHGNKNLDNKEDENNLTTTETTKDETNVKSNKPVKTDLK